jgi:hypothetical protein
VAIGVDTGSALPLGFSLSSPCAARLAALDHGIEATGSHVPSSSPDQAPATCVPDAAWPVSRSLPGWSQSSNPCLGFDVVSDSRHVIGGSLSFAFPAPT